MCSKKDFFVVHLHAHFALYEAKTVGDIRATFSISAKNPVTEAHHSTWQNAASV